MYADNIMPLPQTGVHATAQSAKVKNIVNNRYMLMNELGMFTANLAFSCLIKPVVDDVVMYSKVEDQFIITAIISRQDDQSMEMNVEKNLTITSKQGAVSINAQDNINLSTPETMNVLSNDINVLAKTGLFNVQHVQAKGERLTNVYEKIQTLSSAIETVADRVTQHLKYSIRKVTGMDQTHSGEVVITAKNLFSVRSKQTAVLAKQDVKVDGKRIHMG